MSVLTVTDVPDEIIAELCQRAERNGVSAEEEHRLILRDALATPSPAGSGMKKRRTLFEAFEELGRIAPDFEFGTMRKDWGMRTPEL